MYWKPVRSGGGQGFLRKPAEVTGGKALLQLPQEEYGCIAALMCFNDENFAQESTHFI